MTNLDTPPSDLEVEPTISLPPPPDLVTETSAFDQIGYKWNDTAANTHKGLALSKAMLGLTSDENALAEAKSIYKKFSDANIDVDPVEWDDDKIKFALGEASSITKQVLDNAVFSSIVGASAASPIAAITALTPAAAAAPLVFTNVFRAASTSAALGRIFSIEAGNLYGDLITNKIPSDTARMVAIPAGVAIAMVEKLQLDKLGKPVKQAFANWARSEAGKKTIGGYIKGFAGNLATNIVQEEFQMLIGATAETVAAMVEDRPDVAPSGETVAKRAVDTLITTTAGMGLFGAATTGLEAMSNNVANNRISLQVAKEKFANGEKLTIKEQKILGEYNKRVAEEEAKIQAATVKAEEGLVSPEVQEMEADSKPVDAIEPINVPAEVAPEPINIETQETLPASEKEVKFSEETSRSYSMEDDTKFIDWKSIEATDNNGGRSKANYHLTTSGNSIILDDINTFSGQRTGLASKILDKIISDNPSAKQLRSDSLRGTTPEGDSFLFSYAKKSGLKYDANEETLYLDSKKEVEVNQGNKDLTGKSVKGVVRETTGQAQETLTKSVSNLQRMFYESQKKGAKAAAKEINQFQTALTDIVNKSNITDKDKLSFQNRIKGMSKNFKDRSKQFLQLLEDVNVRVQEMETTKVRKEVEDRVGRLFKRVATSETISIQEKNKILGYKEAYGKGGALSPNQEILTEMLNTEKIGRENYSKAKQEQLLRKKFNLNRLKEGKPLSYARSFKKDFTNNKSSAMENLKDSLTRMSNAAQLRMSILHPMDALLDTLDDFKNNTGFFSQLFGKQTNEKLDRVSDLAESILVPVKRYIDEAKITNKELDRIFIYATAQQPKGIEVILANDAVNLNTVEKIKDFKLTPREQKLYEMMRNDLDKIHQPLVEAMQKNFNKDVSWLKNYFPFMFDYDDFTDLKVEDTFSDKAFHSQYAQGKTSTPMAETRKGKKGIIDRNAYDVFSAYIRRAAYAIEMGQHVKDLADLVNDPSIEEVAGDMGKEILTTYVDLLAKSGEMTKRLGVLDYVRRNVGIGVLAVNASATLIQNSSIFNAAVMIGDYAFVGLANSWDYDRMRFVFNNMPEIRDRVGGEVTLPEMMKNKLANVSMKPLVSLDKRMAMATAFGAYVKWCDENGVKVDLTKPNKEGIAYAQMMVAKTQASTRFSRLPLAISSGKFVEFKKDGGSTSLAKALFQFKTFALASSSTFSHDIIGYSIRKKDAGRFANGLFWTLVAYLSEMGIRTAIWGMGSELDDDELAKRYALGLIDKVNPAMAMMTQLMFNPSNPIPMFAYISNAFEANKPEQQALMMTSLAIPIPGAIQIKKLMNEN
jgi:hypothetical protein